MTDTTPLLVVPYRPHGRAAIKHVIYDPTADPDRVQMLSADDDHVALAVAAVLAAHLDEYRAELRTLDGKEPF